MRIITLWQPYATLMVLGLKQNETRSWPTDYRGPLGIHAAAGEPAYVRKLVADCEVFRRVFAEHGLSFKDLPRGKILGSVNVDGMMRTENWVYKHADSFLERTPDEWYFGDYDVGRWAWLTSNPVKLAEPIPAKGKQGFWNYDMSGYDKQPGSQLYLPL